jgi:hypothetical protein
MLAQGQSLFWHRRFYINLRHGLGQLAYTREITRIICRSPQSLNGVFNWSYSRASSSISVRNASSYALLFKNFDVALCLWWRKLDGVPCSDMGLSKLTVVSLLLLVFPDELRPGT